MGQSGSGKTLLVQHLLGEAEPDGGRVRIDGESLWDLSPDERKRMCAEDRIGVFRGGGSRIPESEIVPTETVRGNIDNQLRERQADPGVGGVQQNADDCLREFDLTELADRSPDDLESGERRRLALALALLSDPPLVVIDDPGAAMDVNHLQSLIRTITGWQRRTGATLIVTTHSIEVARGVGQHLAVLRDGRIVASGDAGEMLSEVDELEDFEQRFGSTLSVREADPERLRLARLRASINERMWLWLLVAVLIVIGGATVAVLATGILDNPLAPAQ